MDFDFETLRGLAGKTDVTDVPCPACLGQCKTNEGRRRKCLRIWDDGGTFITFTCARCGVSGFAKPDDDGVSAPSVKVEKQPEKKADKSELCRYLWDKSQPAIGSPVQAYLTGRACWNGARANVRYLPPGGKYPATMISRFGFDGEPLTGVHLTKLKPDGSGKFEGEGPAKITMGDTVGQPIVLNTHDEREELVIAEGNEDTESLIQATGWTGWMAGTANRIPHVVATAVKKGFTKIYVARDVDTINQHAQGRTIEQGASKRALDQAAAITPIIPLSFGRTVAGYGAHLDANAALRRYGKEWLAAAIERCDVQHQFERGLLTFHQMKRRIDQLAKILFPNA